VNLSAVVVNWNSSTWLVHLIGSFGDLSDRLDRIIVIDNASDDFPDPFPLTYANLEICRLHRNLGFAAAANEGIRRAESPYILLLNPDIEVTPSAVEGLYTAICEKQRCAVACGRLVGPGGKPQTDFQIRRLPGVRSVLSDVLFRDEIRRWISAREPEERREPHITSSRGGIKVEQPAAACWMLRKSAWKEIGGFDERFYPAWWEDVDFCLRLKEHGWINLWFPEIRILHQGGISLDRLEYRRFIRIFYRNLLIYWKKHHRLTYPLVWVPVQFGVLIRLIRGRR